MSQFDNFEVCDHPFPSFVPANSKILVVGTFPTHQRNYERTFPFYYGGEGNVFWEVIGKVFKKSFLHNVGKDAKHEREDFLRSKGIGITDMLEKCYRKNGLSQDDYIYPILFRDLFDLLNKNTSIETMVLTSRTKIIGARGLFETYLHQRGIPPPNFWENTDKILEGTLEINGRDIEILVPYSTSKTVIEKKRATVPQLVNMYQLCLA
jgi:G:T/U-mismatch repair DNA glycosylase